MKNTNVTDSQKRMILEYLLTGCPLTGSEGYAMFGCMKVNSRVSDLIREGFNIKKKPITVKNRFGKEVRVMQYSM